MDFAIETVRKYLKPISADRKYREYVESLDLKAPREIMEKHLLTLNRISNDIYRAKYMEEK